MSGSADTTQRRSLGWLGLVGVLVLWLLGGLVGALVAQALTGSEDDGFSAVSTMLAHSALPALLSAVAVGAVVTWLRWWPEVLRDGSRARAWAWVFPLGLVVGGAVLASWSRLSGAGASLVVSIVVTVLAIALSEELAFRGLALTALRDRMPEFWAAVVTTLLFGAAHMLNGGFGNIGQGIVTVLVGYLLYVARRVSGLLVVPVALHAWWDLCVFSSDLGAGSDSPSTLFEVTLLQLVLVVVALATFRLWQRSR